MTGYREPYDFPADPYERAMALQSIMIARATGEGDDNQMYRYLRSEFMSDNTLSSLLPQFVRTCRELGQFWGYIKPAFSRYVERRKHIWDAFTPLLDHLDGQGRAPADDAISEVLSTFDEEGVHHVWAKALSRRLEDPEGAITSARTLLEAVCKRILDEAGDTYTGKDDLQKLYRMAAKQMNLAPDQHTEEVFKTILGNCQSVVGSIASLRNKIGDAHDQGGKPVRPSARHAALAVNLSGTMATFLIETWQAKQ